MAEEKTEFEVAKEIKALLEALPAEKRELAIKWARESVGLPVQHAVGPTHPPLAEGGNAPGGVVGIPRKSLRDFVNEKKPRTDVQFAAVVAYYHQFEAFEKDRHQSIGTADLQDAARLASRAKFLAPSVTMNNAVKQGYLDSPERGSYRLNTVGENLVTMALPDGGDGATQARTVSRKPKRKAAASPRARRGTKKKAR